MTPSKQAKSLGCKSLARVSELSGVPVSTLKHWHQIKRARFVAICELVAFYDKKGSTSVMRDMHTVASAQVDKEMQGE